MDRRTRAEQRAREDHEAMQVTVEINGHMIMVSAPVTYPSSKSPPTSPTGQAATPVSPHRALRQPARHPRRPHLVHLQRTRPAQRPETRSLVSFVDQHGNLYYSLSGHTHRPRGRLGVFPGQSRTPERAGRALADWFGRRSRGRLIHGGGRPARGYRWHRRPDPPAPYRSDPGHGSAGPAHRPVGYRVLMEPVLRDTLGGSGTAGSRLPVVALQSGRAG